MFDFAWSELMVIGAVALVVIGPKDLPKALRTAGTVVRRARSMAREFQNSIEDMIREAELDDVRKTVQEATRFDLDKTIQNTIDPDGQLKQPLIADTPAAKPAEVRPPEPNELPAETRSESAQPDIEPPPLSEPFIAPRIPPAP
jgi:sec-independent protein translocase protein TatB